MPLKNVAVYCCCHCWAPCLQCWNSNPNSLNNPQSPSSLLSLFFLVCCDPFVGGSLLNHECGSLVATWGYYSLHFALELYINRPITCVAPTVRQKTAWSSQRGYHLLRPVDWYIAAISGVDEWYNICCVSFWFPIRYEAWYIGECFSSVKRLLIKSHVEDCILEKLMYAGDYCMLNLLEIIVWFCWILLEIMLKLLEIICVEDR